MTNRIEAFKSALGQIKFRFVTESILHPGQPNRSLRSWNTRDAARKAAKRSVEGR